MRTRTAACFALGLFFAVATTARAADDYQIKLNRSAQGGDKAHLVAKATTAHSMKVAIGDMPPADAEAQQITAAIDAQQEVLKVDQGHPVKMAFKITKLTGTLKRGGENVKLDLPGKGDELVAEFKDGRAVFSVGGSPLGENESQVLSSLIELSNAQSASDDDAAYGTNDRKKVGDTWKMNPEAVAKELAKKGAVAPPAGIEGGVKLAEAKDVAGVPALKLDLDVKVKGLTLPLPNGIKVDSSNVHVTGSMTVPVDPNLPPLGETMNMQMSIAMTTEQNGQSIKMTSTDTATKEATATPVKE